MLIVRPGLQIPLREFTFTFARSSGPGGQNVNKVSSKVFLRWDVARSPSLPGDVRKRLTDQCGRRLTASGELVVVSQRFRDAGRNVADCLEKVRLLLAAACATPRVRKATRPTRGSVERRLREKKARSDRKRNRRISDAM